MSEISESSTESLSLPGDIFIKKVVLLDSNRIGLITRKGQGFLFTSGDVLRVFPLKKIEDLGCWEDSLIAITNGCASREDSAKLFEIPGLYRLICGKDLIIGLGKRQYGAFTKNIWRTAPHKRLCGEVTLTNGVDLLLPIACRGSFQIEVIHAVEGWAKAVISLGTPEFLSLKIRHNKDLLGIAKTVATREGNRKPSTRIVLLHRYAGLNCFESRANLEDYELPIICHERCLVYSDDDGLTCIKCRNSEIVFRFSREYPILRLLSTDDFLVRLSANGQVRVSSFKSLVRDYLKKAPVQYTNVSSHKEKIVEEKSKVLSKLHFHQATELLA